MYVDLKLPL